MARIFLVDDNPLDRAMFADFLQKQGHHVEETDDGKELISRVSNFNPDLVLLDIFMEKKEGFETLIELRKNYPSLPVIMISSNEVYLQMADQFGANDYFIKGYALKLLQEKIENVLQG